MRALLLAAALAAAASSAQAATLRIAAVTGTTEACHPIEGGAPAGEKAYYKLLQQRLGRDILKCPVADRAAAGQALAAGKLDLAVLDPAAFTPVRAQTRSILTVRPNGSLNRIPVLVATKASSPRADLPALRGTNAIYTGPGPAALVAPRKAVADQGAGPGFFVREDVAANPEAAVVKLRSGGADAMVINAAAWQRLCRGDRPKDDLCKDLKVVWRGRQRAVMALAIRRDTPDELRFRLIGIHVAMHIEAKDAFAWAANWMPAAAEFEPTEADALALVVR